MTVLCPRNRPALQQVQKREQWEKVGSLEYITCLLNAVSHGFDYFESVQTLAGSMFVSDREFFAVRALIRIKPRPDDLGRRLFYCLQVDRTNRFNRRKAHAKTDFALPCFSNVFSHAFDKLCRSATCGNSECQHKK